MLNAVRSDDAQKLLFENKITKKDPQFMNHLNKNILPKKEEWAISERIRKKLCAHNVDTTNYIEVSFRITKGNQFNRVEAYNLADLLDIVLDNSIYLFIFMHFCPGTMTTHAEKSGLFRKMAIYQDHFQNIKKKSRK